MSGSVTVGQGQSQTITTSEALQHVTIDSNGALIVSGSGVNVTANIDTLEQKALFEVTNHASLFVEDISDYRGTLEVAGGGTLEEGFQATATVPVSFGSGTGNTLILNPSALFGQQGFNSDNGSRNFEDGQGGGGQDGGGNGGNWGGDGGGDGQGGDGGDGQGGFNWGDSQFSQQDYADWFGHSQFGGDTITGSLINFGRGDTIDVPVPASGGITSAVIDTTDASCGDIGGNSELVLKAGNEAVYVIPLAGTVLPANTHFDITKVSHDGQNYDQISPACYAAGTRILTARGEVAVEELHQGDLVVTLSGRGAPLKPVKWIGSREIDISAHPYPDRVRPVRMLADAFGQGMPQRDLVVSPDHAVFVDGVLVSAAKLVNGITVLQDPAIAAVHYFHVELAAHDVLLAEGMPAESYLDTGNRAQFSNSERVVALHPDFAPKRMQTDACAPFVEDGPVLAGIRQRLIERVAAQGYVVSHEPELCLMVNGRTVRPSAVSGMGYRFEVEEGAREIRIVSRSGTPGGVTAENTDMRRLGVCLGGIVLHAAAGARAIAMDHTALGDGFHDVESNGAVNWRWTDGNAGFPVSLLDGLSGSATVELRLLWPGAYWTGSEPAEAARRSA